ncbi:MAG: competence protein CoiA family protein [Bacillaceae bacterium]
MLYAHFHNKKIFLPSFKREDYQKLYEESRKGNITCPSCHQELVMYLGILKQPHFIHRTASQCTGPSELKKEIPISYIERDGFHLPQGRAINEDTEQAKWKHTSTLKKLIPFVKKNTTKNKTFLSNKNLFLSSSQYEAVTTIDGPLLVLAGAGSGKTRVLTARTAYMLTEGNIHPKELLLVTFTSKAAQEMKERIQSICNLPPSTLNNIVIGTFHSIFYKILLHHDRDKWLPDKLLKYDWQKERIIKEIGQADGLNEQEFPYDQALGQIGYWKNTLTLPEDVRPTDKFEQQVHTLYVAYEQRKKELDVFDFDDMLLGCYDLFKNQPDILNRYQNRFRYFLIDEFQDINNVQYKIIQMMSKNSNNICVVGDDDQAVYSFRGSNPSFILEFKEQYPDAKVITLSDNYRSNHEIVTLANDVIRHNQDRHIKKMEAQYAAKHTPIFFFPYDEEEEATMILTDIKEKIKNGAQPKEFTILFRTNVASRAIFERLSQSGLPFNIERDQDSFYERRLVRTVLGFLRLSLNGDDVKAMNDIIPALFLKQKTIQELKALSILEDCTIVQALTKLENLHAFQQKKLQKIVPLFQQLKRLSPIVAIETIEKEMGLNDYIKKRGNEGNAFEKGSDDIRDLKVVARKYDTILSFLEHVDHIIGQTKEMKQKKKQENAIQLLTIHRSKGLENTFVYILGVVDGSIPHDFALESYRNGDNTSIEEERRLLYVAITRAKECLYLSIPQTRRGKITHPSRFIRSLYETKKEAKLQNNS